MLHFTAILMTLFGFVKSMQPYGYIVYLDDYGTEHTLNYLGGEGICDMMMDGERFSVWDAQPENQYRPRIYCYSEYQTVIVDSDRKQLIFWDEKPGFDLLLGVSHFVEYYDEHNNHMRVTFSDIIDEGCYVEIEEVDEGLYGYGFILPDTWVQIENSETPQLRCDLHYPQAPALLVSSLWKQEDLFDQLPYKIYLPSVMR